MDRKLVTLDQWLLRHSCSARFLLLCGLWLNKCNLYNPSQVRPEIFWVLSTRQPMLIITGTIYEKNSSNFKLCWYLNMHDFLSLSNSIHFCLLHKKISLTKQTIQKKKPFYIIEWELFFVLILKVPPVATYLENFYFFTDSWIIDSRLRNN